MITPLSIVVDKSKLHRQLVVNPVFNKLPVTRQPNPIKTMEKVIQFILSLPLWGKIIAVIVVTLIAIVLFCSCGTSAKLPDVSDYKVGAEGVVSKEKNVTKQTKWYFKPQEDSLTY